MNTYYFDNSATTKVKDEVLIDMLPFFSEKYGNPSSVYGIARESKKAIDEARENVANLIGANKHEIYFTGCGSEADNMALKGVCFKDFKKNHIITSKIEHHAILDSCKFLEKLGFEVTYLNVDNNGFINLNELENSITDKTCLISIMFANNEIGTIQPIEDIGNIAKKNNILFHTDAVQAIGNVIIDVKKLNIDMLSMSSHKIYGPKGVGALYVNSKIKLEKFLNGGHQENDMRAGTENVAGIVGFGKAAKLSKDNLDEHIENVKSLKDYFVSEVTKRIPNIVFNGAMHARLPGNCNISFENINANDLLLELDNVGICASSGSACNSKDPSLSHVLTAISLPESLIKGAIRFTFGDFNNKDEIDYLLEHLEKSVKKLREQS